MEIIVAAALIAVGLVVAAIVFARTHRGTALSVEAAAGTAGKARMSAPTALEQTAVPERRAALGRREDARSRREQEWVGARAALGQMAREEIGRAWWRERV